ncbi:MAG: response regulator [Phycisphaerales bacterium]|nr:MAG: response regulator [Phycisphaerales bacterium]
MSGSQPNHSSGRVNSIGMRERELSKLVNALDAADRAQNASQRGGPHAKAHQKKGVRKTVRKRVHARWPFLAETVKIELEQPSGGSVQLVVACRNISQGGASLLHRAYVHPNTACRISLPHRTHGHAELTGTIMHCQHLTGVVHELGVKFDEPINIKEFLEPDPLASYYSLENIEPAALTGRILLAEAGELDREIVRHFMRETHVRIAECASGDETLAVASTGVTAILADFHLPDMNGAELVAALRAEGVHAPIILMSSDKSPIGRDAVSRANADAFIAKPINQDLLLRVLAEYLFMPGSPGAPAASTNGVPPELAAQFLTQMRRCARELAQAIQQKNAMACYATCMRISGTAPCFGQGDLARVAETAGQAIAHNMSTEDARVELSNLLSACARITGIHAAA